MQHRWNEAIRVKLFREMEGGTMSKLEHLLQQAARAERLSKSILDTLTVERLQAFAADCRAQASALPREQPASSTLQHVSPAA
jgi:hypothetical protein